MTADPPELVVPLRPAFRDGQTLRADDLRTEADDRRAAMHGHQAHAHAPGVVAGLGLAVRGRSVTVSPGAAIDPRGRTILLPAPRTFNAPDDQPFDVWIAYDERSDEPNAPDRIREDCVLFTAPHGVPPRTDPALAPVFLGSIVSGHADDSLRASVGAVGARIESASRLVRIALGPSAPDDRTAFAIATRTAGDFADILVVDSAGSLTLDAPCDVANGGARVPVVVAADAGVSFAGATADPTARPGGVNLVDAPGAPRELRFAIHDPGAEQRPERYRLSIGTLDADVPESIAFFGGLIVDAAKTVTVVGDLAVRDAGGATDGMILRIAPPAAAQEGLVGPNDLLIRGDPFPTVHGSVVRLSMDAQLINKGRAGLVGARLDATLFPKDDTSHEPIAVALLERLALEPGQACAFVVPVGGPPAPLEIPLAVPGGPDFGDKTKFPTLTLLLTAIGAGPGNVLAKCARRFDFTNG